MLRAYRNPAARLYSWSTTRVRLFIKIASRYQNKKKLLDGSRQSGDLAQIPDVEAGRALVKGEALVPQGGHKAPAAAPACTP